MDAVIAVLGFVAAAPDHVLEPADAREQILLVRVGGDPLVVDDCHVHDPRFCRSSTSAY